MNAITRYVRAARLSEASRVSRVRRLWHSATLAHIVPLAALLNANTASAAQLSRASQPSMAFVSDVSLTAHTLELTLADAVYLGLRENRGIRGAYLQRIAQKFDLRVAEDSFTPKAVITSKYQASRAHDDRNRDYTLTPAISAFNEWGTRFSLSWTQHFNQADQAGRNGNNGLTFGVIQPLLRGAGREVGSAPVRLARLNERHNRLGLKSTVSQTVTRIISAYRELLRAQEQQRIALDALARSKQLLEVNNVLIAAGRMAQFESVQTEADLASQELGVEETANQLDASRLALLQLLALDLGTRLRASEALKAERLEIDHQRAMQMALAQQPQYLQQLIASEQADINLVVAKNQRLWDVSLVGGANQARHRSADAGNRDTEKKWGSYAGVQVEIPIGDLSARQRAVSAQVAVEDQAIQQAEARQLLEQEVDNAIRDMGTRWRQYEIAQRAHELSRRKLDIERDKLHVGRSSNFQVLSFEADLRHAENATLNAQIAYLNAQTQLDERLGMTLESWDIALND